MMDWRIIQGDALESLKQLETSSVNSCVTSPPYWGLRDYDIDGQIGLEGTPEEYVRRLVAVFRALRRVLVKDGTLWLNLGDTYFAGAPNRNPVPGLKPKDLVGIPWRVAFALQADGWYLRSEIIWHKPNPMPESVTDRPTKAHEYIFLLAKAKRYHYDADAIREEHKPQSLARYEYGLHTKAPCDGFVSAGGASLGNVRHVGRQDRMGDNINYDGRNKRSVWTVATQPFVDAHFATFPPALVKPMILAGCPVGGTVLDPFCGAGTTGLVALRLGRRFVGIELNPKYVEMARRRIKEDASLFNTLDEERLGEK